MTQPQPLPVAAPDSGDTLVLPEAHRLLQCVLDELSASSLSGLPERVSLMPGGVGVTFDDCCAGQLWVRITRVFPTQTSTDPLSAAILPGAAIGWGAEFEVGLLRCGSFVSESGEPPAPEDLDRDVEVAMDDARAVRAAILCRFVDRGRPFNLGTWLPVDNDGGCVGGLVTVVVPLDSRV